MIKFLSAIFLIFVVATMSKTGTASFYHSKFEGRKTANGEVFRNNGYTAASNQFKLGDSVRVTNLENMRKVNVKINDRMADGIRLIDLTQKVARDLGYYKKGITKVKVEKI
jgi:rare lipoprotein A